MKPSVLSVVLVVCMLGGGGVAAQAEALTLYLSPTGSDLAAGTREAPFASLERARDELRLRKWSGTLTHGATVELLPGTYTRTQPFELTADDSGPDPAHPIIYAAGKGAIARLQGGKAVNNFQPVSDPEILAQLDRSVHGKVLQADLNALGITEYGPVNSDGHQFGIELFCDDQPMHIARWPNESFAKIVDVLTVVPFEGHGVRGDKGGKFIYEGDRPTRWSKEADLWLHGYWCYDWSDSRQWVSKIDTQTKVIELAPPQHGRGYRKDQWYYAFNALSEIDAPGEWYLDRIRSILYFLPPAPLKPDSVVVSMTANLLTLKHVANVTVRGLLLEACRGTAITANSVDEVALIGCTIRNTGYHAIEMEGRQSGVFGCDIYNIGFMGVILSGGCRTTLMGAGMVADNNHIHNVGRVFRMGSGGIGVSGVGNRVSHNLIDNTPHTAIWFSGNDNVIEYNELHSVCYESNDAGAIYGGRNWTMRGNIIRNNYLHDISGFRGQGCSAVYLDDQFCGALVQGNVFHNIKARGVFLAGGRDNSIDNNIFVACQFGVHSDDRGQGWQKNWTDKLVAEAKTQGTLSGILYNRPPYSDRFPELARILDEQPGPPHGNVLTHNIFVGGKWDGAYGATRFISTIKNNLIDQDPQFVDPSKPDFRLKPTSPAFALGFQPLPLARMGLYPDDRRATWPVVTVVRAQP